MVASAGRGEGQVLDAVDHAAECDRHDLGLRRHAGDVEDAGRDAVGVPRGDVLATGLVAVH